MAESVHAEVSVMFTLKVPDVDWALETPGVRAATLRTAVRTNLVIFIFTYSSV